MAPTSRFSVLISLVNPLLTKSSVPERFVSKLYMPCQDLSGNPFCATRTLSRFPTVFDRLTRWRLAAQHCTYWIKLINDRWLHDRSLRDITVGLQWLPPALQVPSLVSRLPLPRPISCVASRCRSHDPAVHVRCAVGGDPQRTSHRLVIYHRLAVL